MLKTEICVKKILNIISISLARTDSFVRSIFLDSVKNFIDSFSSIEFKNV